MAVGPAFDAPKLSAVPLLSLLTYPLAGSTLFRAVSTGALPCCSRATE
jgi:hypothetical protein